MIYTCTMNPSLDYFMEFEVPVEPGHVNRSVMEYYEAGGKGVNCSVVLNNLGVPSRAFGFLGGFTKDFYISLLNKYELIEPRFTVIDGNTRINVKVTGANCIECNAVGPYINDEDFERFAKKANRLMEGDVFILSGSAHPYLVPKLKELFKSLHDEGVKICIDSTQIISEIGFEVGAHLILFSQSEASTFFNCDMDETAILKAAKQALTDNVRYIIITFNKNKSALICKEGVFVADSIELPQERINGVGFDDSILAGFMMNSLRSPDFIESFQFANSCGQATLFSKGLATRDHINKVYEKIKVEKIDL